MTIVKHVLQCCTLCLLLSACDNDITPTDHDSAHYLLMVSFDGLRADYLDNPSLVNFQWMKENGVSSEGLVPAYPSNTFPNHYSLITGMYPGNHLLIDNHFYRPDLDLHYNMYDRDSVENPDFYGGLPLWQYVQQFGHRSASFFWVGSEAPVAGSFPDYYQIFDDSIGNEQRIVQIFDWLELPDHDRPDFLTLYFSLVDKAGHRFGPDSSETQSAVQEADRLLGIILENIRQSKLPVNLLVVSDHGMVDIPPDNSRTINQNLLTSILTDNLNVISVPTHWQIYSDDKKLLSELKEKLTDTLPDNLPLTVYLKEELPAHWHMTNSNAAGDLWIVSDKGYVIRELIDENQPVDPDYRGMHGYDALDQPELWGIFLGWGPGLGQGQAVPPVENIHVYPLATRLMGLPVPEEIDGKLSELEEVLVGSE